ncbi:hypothetical protein IAT38_002419 [Cryptococcus sp. DSM 104549]
MSQPNATASSSKHKKDKTKSKSKHHHKEKAAAPSAPAADATGKKKDKKHKHKESKGDKSPFEHRVSRMRMSVPPKFAADVMMGVREKLDGMIMRYVPQMEGVLLAHWDHSFDDDTVKILNECPYAIITVEFHSILWAPKIGQKLYGTHSLSSPSHLSLLFSKTFNVSIPLQHIPRDLYEFEHTDEVEDADTDSEDEDDDLLSGLGGLGGVGVGGVGVHEVGRWRERESGKLLGEGGKIRFTVIGVQVTNQMLSLTGSLLSDPSNPPPAPEPSALPVRAPSPTPSPSPEPEARAPKKARVAKPPRAAAVAQDIEPKEEVDFSSMTARELKAYRKEEEKKKREARKARKGDKDAEDVQVVDEPAQEAGVKRKAGGDDGEKRKKKKGE